MKTDLTERVLDAGYESLFFLGGFLAFSLHPTPRNQNDIFRWLEESSTRRIHLRRLQKRGLIESGGGKEEWVPRLTELGHAVFAGGRHPEEAWNRSWDGKWRLLTFDLPRNEHRARMKFGRWLGAKKFGRLQGSVWISPDPVPDIAEVITSDRIDPKMVLVFEGGLAGTFRPQEVAVMAWDFDSINTAYRRYTDFTTRILQQVQRKPPSLSRLRDILRKDRKAWWDAVLRDPFLPKPLLPKRYEGSGAWKLRCQLLKKLGKNLGNTVPS